MCEKRTPIDENFFPNYSDTINSHDEEQSYEDSLGYFMCSKEPILSALSELYETNYIIKNIKLEIADKKSRTSVRLTRYQWSALEDICIREDITYSKIFSDIGQKINWQVAPENRHHRKKKQSLSNAIRMFILAYYYHLLLSKET